MAAFLADENFPKTSIELLRKAGHDVISVAETIPSALDEDILKRSVSDDRIVITLDRDFGDLIFNRRLSIGAGVIYLRLGEFRPDEPANLILKNLSESPVKFNGLFTVISRAGIRQKKV